MYGSARFRLIFPGRRAVRSTSPLWSTAPSQPVPVRSRERHNRVSPEVAPFKNTFSTSSSFQNLMPRKYILVDSALDALQLSREHNVQQHKYWLVHKTFPPLLQPFFKLISLVQSTQQQRVYAPHLASTLYYLYCHLSGNLVKPLL